MSKLDLWLRANRIRPSAFAATVGVSHTTISRILKGERRPSWKLAARIDRATAGVVSVSDFAAEYARAA